MELTSQEIVDRQQKQQEPAPVRRQRRTVDQQIADLGAKIAALKEREARKQAKADPALRQVGAAVKAIDKALQATADARTKRALSEARSTLMECLGMSSTGTENGRVRRSADEIQDLGGTLLSYVSPTCATTPDRAASRSLPPWPRMLARSARS